MKRYRFTLCLTFLIVACAQALAQERGEVLIKNATIMTASHGTIENGSILIRNGKIVAVGRDVTGGSGAKVIDATGMYVTPGLIDAHSHTAADGGVNEGSLSVSAMVRMRDVVNDRDPNIYRQLAGGTTTIHLMHGSANSIGGQNVVLKLRWGKTAEEMVFTEAPRTIKFALGENPKRAGNPQNPFGGGRAPRYPATRMGVAETIREAFTQGREYVQKWDAYEAAIKKGEKPLAPRRDLKLDAIADILRGKLLVHSHCYRADEILMLMEVAREFGFKIQTFQHVLEGYKVAREIAAHGAGGSTFSDWWAYKMEAYDAIPGNAAIMSSKGVVVSINSDSADLARRLYQEAAKTIKYGNVPEEEALRFVTLNPARQLKIDNRVGSIDVGKDADIAIFNGHPFSIYSRVEMTLIEGTVYFDRKVDLARREQVAREKKALIEAERRSAGQPQATPATPAPPPTPNVEEEEHPHPNR